MKNENKASDLTTKYIIERRGEGHRTRCRMGIKSTKRCDKVQEGYCGEGGGQKRGARRAATQESKVERAEERRGFK